MSPDLGETVAFGIIALCILGSGLASSMVKRTFHSVMFLGVTLVSVAALFILLGSPLIGVIQILVYVGGILTLFVFAVMFVAGDDEEQAPYVARPRSSAWGILAAVAMVPVVMWWAFGPMFGLPKVLPTVFDVYVVAANLLGGHGDWPGQGAGFTASILYLVALVVAAIVVWMGIRHVLYTWSPGRMLGAGVAVGLVALMAAIAVQTAPWQSTGTDAAQTAANDLDAIVASLFGAQVVAFEVLGVLLTAVMIGALVIARPLTGVADKDRYSHVTRRELEASQRVSDPAAPAAPVVDLPPSFGGAK